MAQQTPLYEQHTLCGARMVDFHGWMMPLHYGSQLDEHHAVRTDAGMFDVSHMTIVDLRGSRTREFLRYLLANDVAKLTKTGKALYSGMLNASGGVIDGGSRYEAVLRRSGGRLVYRNHRLYRRSRL